MQTSIQRTGATHFSDPELLILDIAAMHVGRRSMFVRDIFPLQFNYASHGLDDDSLTETLNRFEAQGVLRGEDFTDDNGDVDRYVEITDFGGALWESERKPDWTRFVRDSYRNSRPNSQRHRVCIFGHSPLICRAFFDAGCSSEFFNFRDGPISTGTGHRKLIYWRPAQTVFMLSAWTESWHSKTDWDHFEIKRCWWRNADEIGKLWGWPTASVG